MERTILITPPHCEKRKNPVFIHLSTLAKQTSQHTTRATEFSKPRQAAGNDEIHNSPVDPQHIQSRTTPTAASRRSTHANDFQLWLPRQVASPLESCGERPVGSSTRLEEQRAQLVLRFSFAAGGSLFQSDGRTDQYETTSLGRNTS